MPSFSPSQWQAIQERHAAEVDGLRRVLTDVRQALGTPDDVDIRSHARQIAGEAAVGRAVPWDALRFCIDIAHFTYDVEQDRAAKWFDASAPQEVATA